MVWAMVPGLYVRGSRACLGRNFFTMQDASQNIFTSKYYLVQKVLLRERIRACEKLLGS